MTSKIEWTNDTWNVITGCTKASEGCKNCYAETMTKRLKAMGQEKYKHGFNKVVFHNNYSNCPVKGKNKLIFVNSMSDTFHKDITNWQVRQILDECEWHCFNTFQILTKRAERLPDFTYPDNVWLGVTVEMEKYKSRIDYLRKTNAKVKFLSCEPLLEDLGDLDLEGIHWVIAGGESGHNARPCHPAWVRNIQKQCEKQGVPFFFKQWGEWVQVSQTSNFTAKENMKILLKDGQIINGIYPKDVKEFEQETNQNIDNMQGVIIARLGKKKAGAMLDCQEFKQYPKILTEVQGA